MPIRIDGNFMSLEIDGKVIATATEQVGGWWEVTHWPRLFDRNQAITALTVTELLETAETETTRSCGRSMRSWMTSRGKRIILSATVAGTAVNSRRQTNDLLSTHHRSRA